MVRRNTPEDEVKAKPVEPEIRDMELENLIGNLLIAEVQVDKLRSRLSDRFRGIGVNSASVDVYKHNNKYYRVSVKIDEMVNE